MAVVSVSEVLLLGFQGIADGVVDLSNVATYVDLDGIIRRRRVVSRVTKRNPLRNSVT